MLSSVLAAALLSPAHAQWGNARLLNKSTESDAKTARVAAAKTGGFHVTYGNANPWQTRYRRWENGSFIRDVTIKTVFAPNGDIAEAGNGDIHVVWEDWDGTEQIGWAKSTDGGLTFVVRDATSYGNSPDGQAKHPGVAAWGADNSANMMMSSWNADSKQMFYNTLTNAANPAAGNTYTGFNGDNQYAVNGMCRSLQDGTIYRLLSRSIGGVISVVMRRFNGSSWDPEVVVASCGFFARESIAVNPVGQIMTSWEQDNHLFTRLYTPGTGWAAITDMGEAHFGWVTAVPTTNDFYMTYANGAQNNCYGRRWSNGWFPTEDIAIGIPDGFTPDTHCAAGPDGTIYAVWEYWGAGNGQWSDKPQQWFNVLPGVSGSRGTLSGVVIDQYGAGVPGATVASGAFATIAGTNGAYSLNLPTGTQSISATKQYYTSQTINVSITQNQTTIQNFTIQANPPSPVSAFVVTPSNTVNRLSWTNPSSGNFSGTMIRWKTTGYPTSPTDGTLLANKTNNPSTTDTYDHTGLTNGTNYYYTAFSHDDLNHYAAGIVAQGKPTNLRIGEIKGLANGMIVDLLGKTVSGKFASDGVFYIQESDRSSAIRILGTTTAIVGQKVDVTSGQLDTRVLSSQNSERQIKLATITPQSSGTIIPVTMNSRALGGQSFGPNVPGVKDGVGLNNMGLLVRLTGKVVDKLATYLWMDDGGGIIDSAGIAGVLVKCPSTTIPVLIGDIVSVVGIIEGSVPSGDTQNRRQIRLRDYNDLIALASTGPGTISGSVTDGVNGIIGAIVTANPGGYSTTTGTGGSYSLTSIPSGLFTVSASKSGYTDASSLVTVNAGQTSTANFTLTRTPGAVTGTVRDASLQGIQGAAVTLSPGGYQTTSDAGGIYRILNVPVGIYSATATKSGYTPQTIANQTVPSGGVATVNFTLGVATSQEKLVNGNFEGGFNSFGYGLIALDWTDVARDANSQNATDWGSFNAGSPHNNVQSVYTVSPPNGEAGISQTVIGLAPGAGYTFTAEAYQTSSSTTCWMAVDENGGSTLPSRTISFSNNSNTWNTQTVSGNVGSSGSLTVFLWGWNSATPGGAVYFDNANLVVNP